MNNEQNVSEDQQAANPQWNTQMNKTVYIRQENIPKFCLVPRPHRHQMTHRKYRRMTHLIEAQGKN